MNEQLCRSADPDEPSRGLITLSVLALLTGLGAGVVGALFRMSLEAADRLRDSGLVGAHGHEFLGLVAAVLVCGAATAAAACMVRRIAPHAAGSGIPHVEAVLRGESAPAALILMPVKFVGGVLAIGCGLALGREGPTV
jgi:chloride channel protein, CIC family